MAHQPPLTDAQGEVRELTAADMLSAGPASQTLPTNLQQKLGLGSRIAARFDGQGLSNDLLELKHQPVRPARFHGEDEAANPILNHPQRSPP
ncbi:hypothetical protein [uncultured Sphaerotilus sp.]|uniref:hypothetical protein n=1 Tax=uncultured Sphaerotilus sp. TaxID=474984 RepID=UPI0030CA3247